MTCVLLYFYNLCPSAAFHVMVATERHVGVRASNAHLSHAVGLLTVAEERLRSVHTVGAEGPHLLHAVGEGDELQDFAEGFAVGVAIQTHYNDVFAVHVYGPHDEFTKLWEELSLLHDDELRGLIFRVFHVADEVRPVEARHTHIVVVDDHWLGTIAGVGCVAHEKDGVADGPVAVHDTDDGRRLAGKHRANNEFQRHFSYSVDSMCSASVPPRGPQFYQVRYISKTCRFFIIWHSPKSVCGHTLDICGDRRWCHTIEPEH